MLYLTALTLTLGCSSSSFGFVMAGTGPCISALRYQLNWGNDSAVIDLNSTILSTAAVFGIAIGSIFGGDFIKYGRRSTLIKFNLIGLFASITALFRHFYWMCFGRFLFGVSSGVLMCTTPKILEETIPANVMDKGFGTSTNILINVANFLCLIMAVGMPEE